MKRRPITVLVALLTSAILFQACHDDLTEPSAQQPAETNEESRTLPEIITLNLSADTEADSRLAFMEGLVEGKTTLTSTWSAGDGFNIIGTTVENGYLYENSQCCTYTLIDGENTAKGTFQATSTTFSSPYYSLYYPATVKSWGDFAYRSLADQVQSGNGSTAHLKDFYTCRHAYFNDVEKLSFHASENFYQTGCLRFNLSGFDSEITPTAIELSVVDENGNTLAGILESHVDVYSGREESLKLSCANFSPASSITAYLMLPAYDMEIPTGCSLRVTVKQDGKSPLHADKPAGGKTIRGGLLNTLTVTEGWEEPYVSTDFSADQQWFTIQTASQGNGIDIYLMGDGFSDRQIADGTYADYMESTVSCLFSEEPYASFKDCFNIYYINAVSQNEGYIDGGSTAFSGWFGEGTQVGGNHDKCQEYAGIIFKGLYNREMSNADWNNITVIVPMNSQRHAGTCYFGSIYTGTESKTPYGKGYSISYFPVGQNTEHLSQLVLHEAGGHGFGKLLDEYYYSGTIPPSAVSQNMQNRTNYGWGWNVDYTSDPSAVVWAKFLTDNRFDNQGLGVYEGADTYQYGAYRPTDNSIMRDNTGGYNAPSREAIYYRIQKLAFGQSPDYEKFVNWDLNHRSRASRTYTKIYPPTAPPVRINLPVKQ